MTFNFFDIFIWSLPKIESRQKVGALAYDILFPITILCIVHLKKYKFYYPIFVIFLTITSQLFVKCFMQISIIGYYKITLSFIACLTLLYIAFKNIKKAQFQVFMILLLSGIPLIDMFFNAAISRYINFEINNWKIFLVSYIVYLSIICSLFIYFYGRQLFKNPYPTI
jgi:hypothetical protein